MAYGFVYVLTNPAMPGIVKIGHTERSPHARCDELSKSTSAPLPFRVWGYVEVRDSASIERMAHIEHEEVRVSPNREFFYASPFDALRTLFGIANDEFEVLSWFACAEHAEERNKRNAPPVAAITTIVEGD